MLPTAMGAVVVLLPIAFHTPLSGHFWPVFAVVPIGFLIINLLLINDQLNVVT